MTSNFLILGALLQSFEGKSLTAAKKVVGSWLANAKWGQQSDGTLHQKPSKSNSQHKSRKSSHSDRRV